MSDENDRVVSPAVAVMARQYGIDLDQMEGSGKDGRITKRDVLRYVAEKRAQEWPNLSGSDGAALEVEPAEPVKPAEPAAAVTPAVPETQPGPHAVVEAQRPVAAPSQPVPVVVAKPVPEAAEPAETAEMAETEGLLAARGIAHVVTEADMSRVLAHQRENRERFAEGEVRFTLTAYFAMAAITALKSIPHANSRRTRLGVIPRTAVHLGLAVAAEEDMRVPVIRQADRLPLARLCLAVQDVIQRTRSGATTPADFVDGTFTLLNVGARGPATVLPGVFSSEAASLGVGALRWCPVVIEREMLAIRPKVTLALSFDPGAMDHVTAVSFLNVVQRVLEHWA